MTPAHELDDRETTPRPIPGGRRRTDHEGFVTITNREVYDRLGLVQSQVADLSTKLDPVGVAITAIQNEVHDHETRLRSLERRAWALAGGAAVIGGVAAKLSGVVGLG